MIQPGGHHPKGGDAGPGAIVEINTENGPVPNEAVAVTVVNEVSD